MIIEAAAYAKLQTVTAVTDLVSTRIYPNHAPQAATMPYIVYNRISQQRIRHMTATTQLRETRIQYDCIAADPLSARNVADALIAALDHDSGTWDSGGSNQASIAHAFIDNNISDFDQPTSGEDEGNYRVIVDVVIWHAE